MTENFAFSFNFFDNGQNLKKNNQLLVEKLKALHKYCSDSFRTTVRTEFVLEAQVQNNNSRNISNSGLCSNSRTLNMSLKSE